MLFSNLNSWVSYAHFQKQNGDDMYGLISALLIMTTQVSGWEIFAKTRFKWEYQEELGLQVEIPTFNSEIKELEGEEIVLTGYYLPVDLEGNRIIISKLPYASCFFCGGGAGQESVAEIYFSNVQRPFRGDELITVKGRLKLNRDDYEHLSFLLVDASTIQP